MRSNVLVLGGIMAVTLAGCGGGGTSTTTPQAVSVYGADSAFGKGAMRSYITYKGSVPIEVGVEITEAALASPADLPKPPTGQAAVEVKMEQPVVEASLTPFLSTTMFYSPGHPPESQEVPHLHPSWFIVNDNVRNQILPNNPKSFTDPAAGELPAGWFTPPTVEAAFIPTIGNIFFDPTEAGYNENPFKTSLSEYRYYDSHIACVALGTPNSYPVSKQTLKRPLGVPAKYPESGYFPTSYTIRYNAERKTYVMALGDFKYRS